MIRITPLIIVIFNINIALIFEITNLLLMSRSKYSLLRCTYNKRVGMNQREKDNCYIERRLTQTSKENKQKK